MSMQFGDLIADYPAWSIHKPVPVICYGLNITRPKFRANQIIGLPWPTTRYGDQHHWYMFGSCASYALQYDDCPIRSYEGAKRRGHKTHWLNPMPAVLSNTPDPKSQRVGLSWGDEIVFEGRLFRIDKASNKNADLIEIEI